MPLSISSNVYVFDLEADNLLEEATKIHCLSIGKVTKSGEVKIFTTTDYDEMREFFLNKEITKVGHNIIRYDALIAEKILDIKVDYKILRYFIKYNLKAYDYLPIWKQEKRNDTIDKLLNDKC